MKKKSIILAFILISLFMFMPNSVKAEVDDFCSYNVNNITDDSATLSFKCNPGNGNNDKGNQGMNSVTLYEANCTTMEAGEEVGLTRTWVTFDADGDNEVYNKLEKGKCYFASFLVRETEPRDIPHIVFKTGTGEILFNSPATANSKYNKDLTTEAAKNNNSDYNYTPEAMDTITTTDAETIRATICDEDLKKDLRKYWSWFTIIGPIALIILVSLDFAKAIISGNADTLKKSSTNAVKRTVAVIILLITPWLLKIIFEIVGLEEYICF